MQLSHRTTTRFLAPILLLSTLAPASAFAATSAYPPISSSQASALSLDIIGKLASILQSFSSFLSQQHSSTAPPEQVAAGGNPVVYNFPSASQRIDNLSNTAISNPSITGGRISGGSISGATVAGYLPLAGGTLTGSLTGTDLNLSGTLTAGTLNVGGLSSNVALFAPYFSATSTTATSTFAGNVSIQGNLDFSSSSQWFVDGTSFLLSTSTSLYIGVLSGTSSADLNNTGVGYQVFANDTTGYSNSAFGYQAFMSNTTGYYNSAFGSGALSSNTIGIRNAAFGTSALQNNNGGANTAVGYRSLFLNTTGSSNVAIGYGTFSTNGSATSTTAVGVYAGHGNGITNYSNQGGTYIGYQTGYLAQTGSDYNTFLGYQSGYNVTTGSNNIWIGTATSSTDIANLTTGSQNLLIGNNISLPSATASGQLNIGNLIFGTAVTGTGSTITGKIGIGISNPNYLLDVSGAGHFISFVDAANFVATSSTATSTFAGGFTIGSSQFVVQQGSGNVGIGTSSPTAKLDITGNTSDAVLSSEMISAAADRTFSSNTGNWTGTNWVIGSNVDTHTAGANPLTLSNVSLSSAPVSGNLYQITFTINTTVAGNITPNIGGTNGVVVGSALGVDTEVQVIIAIGSGALTFTPDATWTGTITNVSVMQLTSSSATQVFRSSDSTIGLEIRSGGVGQTTNTFMGLGTGKSNVSGNRNSGFGQFTLLSNTTGFRNTAVGSTALQNNTTGIQNTALGVSGLQVNTIGSDNTSIGYRSMFANSSGSTNTAIGESALQLLTTGSNNIALGYRSGLNLTTGSKNIIIGLNINATSSSATNSLNIGNLIFGTGLDGSGNTISTGNVGIGTTSLTAQFSTTGTVRFSNFGAGTLQTDANGNLSVSSDERLKNIQGTFTRGLADIVKLSPILYQWKPETGFDASTTYAGFSAQNVQAAIPEAVGQDSHGYLTLQDRPLIAALVNAEKEIASITGTFKTNMVAWLGDAGNGIGNLFAKDIYATNVVADDITANKTLCVKKSDGTPVCVTGDQLAAVLAATGQQAAASTPLSTSTSSTGSSMPALVTPPVIQINGANPAIIHIGDAYADLGATITGPQQDLNLGIATFLNGAKIDAIQLDTSTTSTSTIDYVVTDQFGTTATATRTVIVQPTASI
jgi:hypothetical protein